MGTLGQAVSAVLLIGSGLGYAAAQDGGDSTVDIVKVQPLGASPEEPVPSPAAQVRAAEVAVARASASCDALAQALQSAKRGKDIILATCLDDKLSQCNANLQNMKRRETSLRQAAADGDPGLSNHESTVIGVLSQKFKALTQSANQCVGQDLFDTGETKTKEEVDLFAPEGNPAVIVSLPEWPIPFIPPPVSGVT